MRITVRTWTEKECETLKRIVSQGGSAVRAAGALNRTIKACKIQARVLGTPFLSVAEARRKREGPPAKSVTRLV